MPDTPRILLSKKDTRNITKSLLHWSKNNFSDFPWRNTNNLFHAFVAELMLQRTKADQVLPVYKSFIERFNNPDEFVKHIEKSFENIFEHLGLKWRNEVLIEAAKLFCKKGTPSNRESLQEVPGVGEYIYAALLSFHLNIREVLIDSNIVRLYCRLNNAPYNNDTRRKKWLKKFADELTPNVEYKQYNYAVLDYSMNICKPSPNCEKCIIIQHCNFYKNGKQT